jgi:hypothetical protein
MLAGLSVLASSAVEAGGPSTAANDARTFVSSLAGRWHGRATQTPVGETPYDIEFAWVTGDCVGGTADNGFTHHTWTFCDAPGGTTLEFLSDFRGNTRPIRFEVVAHELQSLSFRASTHPFMTVVVDQHRHSRRIDIRHYGELHVRIELERVTAARP